MKMLKTLKTVVALFICAAFIAGSASAQSTNEEKLSYLLLGGNYALSNAYQPNGVHAGIDYSGAGTNTTDVRSPLNGTITANTASCGKVAVFDGQNTVILAHMDSRTSLPVGSTIKRGDYVGKVSNITGSGSGCTVTGSHLHIEIRTGNNTSMGIPTADNRNTTLNPANFFTYNAWEFNNNGDFESWAAINVDTGFVSGGAFVINPSGSDPHYLSPFLSLSAATYRYVKVRMSSNGLDSTGAIYFSTATSGYSESNKVTFTVTNCSLCSSTPYYDYTLDMSTNPNWNGVITGVRVDPTGSGQAGTFADALGIDYVRIQTAP